jgi:hypothetical protein
MTGNKDLYAFNWASSLAMLRSISDTYIGNPNLPKRSRLDLTAVGLHFQDRDLVHLSRQSGFAV